MVNWFESGDVERLEFRRRDPDWLAERHGHALTRYVPVWRDRSLVASGAAVLVSWTELEMLAPAVQSTVLLGERGGTALFGVELDAADERVEAWLGGLGTLADLRDIAGELSRSSAALLAHARAMAYWHRQHRFCGACGAPTESTDAGHLRRCQNAGCGKSHFPRTDPAVIVLVSDGDRCLLGRSHGWPDGLYSTVAGFVEPGESLEDAVRREVQEETGVVVGEARYHSSQPWPFPSSLMLGYFAHAIRTELQVDPHELAAAAWFSRSELVAGVRSRQLRLPRPVSIARRLVDDWYALGGTRLSDDLAGA